jgi:hypothetical protein
MTYEEEIATILAEAHALDIGTRRLHWSLARTNPDAVARVAAAKIASMRQESEPFDLSGPAQHEVAQRRLIEQETKQRQLGASVQRFAVEPAARALRPRLQALVSTMASDPLLSCPGALDRLDPAGMVQLGILRELRQRRLERTDFDGLLGIYKEALQRQDASALVDIEYCERTALTTTAASEEQVGPARALREMVEGIRELRVPIELLSVEPIIRAAETAVTHCDLVPAHPIDPKNDPNAKAAHEAETAAFAREASNQ